MPLLLRSIKRKFMKNNKVTTYLLYAIGEIILVVMGILIAFMVDESRKASEERQLLSSYTQTLIEDLKSDTTYYQKIKKNSVRYLENLEKARLLVENPASDTEDLIEFAKTEYIEGVSGHWGFQPQSLKSFIATGKFDLYPLKIRDAISQLLKFNNEAMLMSAENLGWAITTIENYENKFLRTQSSSLIKPNETLVSRAWKNIDEQEFTASFINLLNARFIVITINNNLATRQIDKTVELIHELQKL